MSEAVQSQYQSQSHSPTKPTAPPPPASTAVPPPTQWKPRPYSNQPHLNTTNKSKTHHQPTKGKPGKPGQQKRDTHFICFPLVTDTSVVQQLAANLEMFRNVATLTVEVARRRRLREQRREMEQGEETPEKQREDVEDAQEGGEGETEGEKEPLLQKEEVKGKVKTKAKNDVDADDLKILPPSAHRSPGTFHLTIGTMDLSEKSEMDRAVEVLKGLDLGKMMEDVEREREREVGSVGGGGLKKKKKEEEEEEEEEEEQGMVEKAAETVKNTVQSLKGSISPPPLPPPRSKSPSSAAPLIISLEGLSAFQSPRKARVFYAPPHDPSNRLLILANKIRNVFKAEGFVTEKRELTLHATVANLKYANKGYKGGRGMQVVDGRGLVGLFGGGDGGEGEKRGGYTVPGRTFPGYTAPGYTAPGYEVPGYAISEYKVDGYKVGGEGLGYSKRTRSSEMDKEKDNRYVWARGIVVDRVRICKMGAEKSEDEVLGMVYPAIKTEDGAAVEVRFG